MRLTLYAAGLLAFCVVAGLIILVELPHLLLAQDPAAPADGIVHLAYDPNSTADEYVAELYRRRVAPEILCASGPVAPGAYPADFAARHLAELGVPSQAVTSLHIEPAGCATPALVDFARSRGWHKVLLVVDPAISGTVRRTDAQRFRAAGIDARVAYSPSDGRDLADAWWHTYSKRQRLVVASLVAVFDWLYPECK